MFHAATSPSEERDEADRERWRTFMAAAPDLPLDGYYRGGPSYLDTYTFLKLYPDGYWIGKDGFDSDFDFPAFLSAIDVEDLKARFPLGCCPPDGAGDFIYGWGRYT